MKKLLLFSLALLLFITGCAPAKEDKSTENTTEAPQTAEPADADPTETPAPDATPGPQAEPPYKDAREMYTSVMTNERDKKWEEDVVYFANTYLDPYHGHALLTDRLQTTTIYNSTLLRLAQSGKENFFDPELKARFIEKINEIILSIPERTDDEVVFGLWEAAALLPDLHAYVGATEHINEEALPLSVAPIQTEDGLSCVIDACGEEYADQLLGRRLIAVNGFTLAEIKEKMRPIIHFESESALDACVVGRRNSCIMACELLRYIGVMDEGDTVTLTVRSADGEETEVSIRSFVLSGSWQDAIVAYYEPENDPGDADFRLVESDRSVNAWYRLLEDGEALYLRINECDADESFAPMLDEAFAAAAETGKFKKVIIDVRSNPGGYPDLEGNYQNIVNYLDACDAEVYILINGESFSGAIALPSMLRRRVEKAQLVGAPGGQPVRFFYGREYYLPNSGIKFKCSSRYADFWPDYGEGPLMPDTAVYQTWEDYLAGYDSVLKYILELK